MLDDEYEKLKYETQFEFTRLCENEKQCNDAIAKKFFEDCTVAGFLAGILFSAVVAFIVYVLR